MSKRVLLVMTSLAVVACTTSPDGSPAATLDLDPSTTVAVTTGAPALDRLVVVDDQGNIVTLDSDGSNPIAITDDSRPARNFQPAWSPVSDRLVWGEGTSQPAVASSAGDGSDRRSVPISSPTFYLSWAPDGSRVGVLYGSTRGVALDVVDPEASTTTTIGAGSPFYFSWSPDGSEMAVHVGGSIFGTIAPGGELMDLGSTTASYQALRWTPAGIFHIDQRGLELVERTGESLLAELSGDVVFFVPNAQGTRVAIEAFGDEPQGESAATSEVATVEANNVSIVDVATGEVDVASEDTSIGFFWSPDGEALLMLQLTGRTGEADVSVWEAGETTLLATITPPVSFFRDVLQFFDQYAQSLQLWSPDSTRVALPGAIEGEDGIWVIPTDGSDPARVHDGSWVSWSHG